WSSDVCSSDLRAGGFRIGCNNIENITFLSFINEVVAKGMGAVKRSVQNNIHHGLKSTRRQVFGGGQKISRRIIYQAGHAVKVGYNLADHLLYAVIIANISHIVFNGGVFRLFRYLVSCLPEFFLGASADRDITPQ